MLKSDEKFTVSQNIVFRQQEDGNFILLQLEGEEIFELKDVSAFIWELITQGKNIQEILQACEDEYEAFGTEEEQSVMDFVGELVGKQIITQS